MEDKFLRGENPDDHTFRQMYRSFIFDEAMKFTHTSEPQEIHPHVNIAIRAFLYMVERSQPDPMEAYMEIVEHIPHYSDPTDVAMIDAIGDLYVSLYLES